MNTKTITNETIEVIEKFLLDIERMNCQAKCLTGFNDLALLLKKLKQTEMDLE